MIDNQRPNNRFVIVGNKAYKKVLSERRPDYPDQFALVQVRGELAHEIMLSKGYSFKQQRYIS